MPSGALFGLNGGGLPNADCGRWYASSFGLPIVSRLVVETENFGANIGCGYLAAADMGGTAFLCSL